ncbi:hypothetical protein FHS56_000330 [Thermonema lapsum]|uniref:Uncharacterized protein n=1 Tax=Thermonema lapsum TaxID=28195 RepID=A0A846MMW7_9BACT|nr:hypothetical protein [Thermonema lapsum]
MHALHFLVEYSILYKRLCAKYKNKNVKLC